MNTFLDNKVANIYIYIYIFFSLLKRLFNLKQKLCLLVFFQVSYYLFAKAFHLQNIYFSVDDIRNLQTQDSNSSKFINQID